jgi:serine/threonine protein kinase
MGDSSKRWHKLRELGEGGQGKVHLVLDRNEWVSFNLLFEDFNMRISKLNSEDDRDTPLLIYELRKAFWELADKDNPPKEYAMKVLHQGRQSADEFKAQERIKDEIRAMQELSHPNLLHIIDANPVDYWFVSKYYEHGTLTNNLQCFAGKILKTLDAFIPLVEAVAYLHKNKKVHRDIKPDNIFLDNDNNLVLGDFGLVYFMDRQRSRLSDTMESAGSHDWKPGWAFTMRLEDVKPTFDVFCLAKVLWAMLSGKNAMPLWYFENDGFNLNELFPDTQSMSLINPILKKCIVEHEKDCLSDADKFLWYLKQLHTAVILNGENIKPKKIGKCKICGIGKYYLAVNKGNNDISNFGISPAGYQRYRLYICGNCGNVQLFSSPAHNEDYPAWNP